MSDEPMNDSRLVVAQEPDIAYKLLSVKDARPHYATVTFIPKNPNHPQLPSWRRMFVSRSLAQEFARELEPNPNPTGSPKQNRLKYAHRLHIQPDMVDLYTYSVQITEVPQNDDSNAPRVPGAFARRTVVARDTRTPSGGPVPSRPTPSDGTGPDLLGAILPDEAPGVPASGATPEDRPFKPWSET